MIFGHSGHVHDPPNQLFLSLEASSFQKNTESPHISEHNMFGDLKIAQHQWFWNIRVPTFFRKCIFWKLRNFKLRNFETLEL